jgi:hypothetical protein
MQTSGLVLMRKDSIRASSRDRFLDNLEAFIRNELGPQAAESLGASRTYVVCEDHRVVAYYALASGRETKCESGCETCSDNHYPALKIARQSRRAATSTAK